MKRVIRSRLMVLTTAVLVLAVTLATAGAVYAQGSKRPSRRLLNVHHVHWADVAIPGRLCRVKGSIQLHDGSARIGRSGFGPVEVMAWPPTYGDLGGGQQVAAVQVLCSNQGGTAAGQLADGIVVFSGTGGRLHSIGTLTPQYHAPGPVHIPFISVASISAGRIVTNEYWYTSSDPDCCPSGHATTTWYWNGHHFAPGRTTVTSR